MKSDYGRELTVLSSIPREIIEEATEIQSTKTADRFEMHPICEVRKRNYNIGVQAHRLIKMYQKEREGRLAIGENIDDLGPSLVHDLQTIVDKYSDDPYNDDD